MATAVASCDLTLNLMASWPFSFIFSGRRSPALEVWLYGFKPNVQREYSDFSHDMQWLAASLRMCIPSWPQSCSDTGRGLCMLLSHFAAKHRTSCSAWLDQDVHPELRTSLEQPSCVCCARQTGLCCEAVQPIPLSKKINNFSSPRRWVEIPCLFFPDSPEK